MKSPRFVDGWLRLPYRGPANALLVVHFDGERHRAWYDRDEAHGWACIRLPERPRRGTSVTLRADEQLAGNWIL